MILDATTMQSRKKMKCSSCGKTFTYTSVREHPTFPFCCERCRDLDLGRWFNGNYVISSPLRFLPEDPWEAELDDDEL